MIDINKKVKYTINVLFIAVVGYLTFRILFQNREISDILKELHRADKVWLAFGALAVFCFIAGESVIIKYMLWLFKEKVPFLRCLKYSFIGFFYSYITPSSSGGQPAQMIYMKKDGIYYGYSSLIMLVIAVVYKAVLVLMGLFFYIFYHGFVVRHVGDYIWLVYLGFVLNIAYIALLLVVCLKPLWSRKMGIKAINLLVRLHIIHANKSEKMIARLTRIFDNYVKASTYIRDNLRSLFTITFFTVLQRLALFMLTWIVYKAYGLHGHSFMQIVALQVIIGIAVEMLLSFYAVIIIGGLVTLFTHLLNIKKYGKDTDKEKQTQELEEATVAQIPKSDKDK